MVTIPSKLSPEVLVKYSIDRVNKVFSIYQDVGNAFVKTIKDDPKDRIEVILGDDKQPDKFYPQVKIKRWDKLKIGLGYRFNLPSIKKAVIDTMLPAFREKIKVFNSIVGFNLVNVMDYFGFRKITTKVFFNYKSVFRNISLFIVKWVARTFNKSVAFTIEFYPTLPVVMFSTRIVTSFPFIPRDVTLYELTHNLSITDIIKLSNLYR